jgi:hypothetical protein
VNRTRDGDEIIEYFGNYYVKEDLSETVGYIFGTILWVLSFPVLFFNERKDTKVVDFYKKCNVKCEEPPNINNPTDDHNNKLVYACAET